MAITNSIKWRSPFAAYQQPTAPTAGAPAPYPPKAPTVAPVMPTAAAATPAGPAEDAGSGAKIVAPEPAAPSMQALQGAGGDPAMGGGPESLGAPSQFRQGIGKRIYPQESAALASLRKAY